MNGRHNVSNEILADGHNSRSYALGLLLSRIFHPIFLNVLMFLVVGFYTASAHLWGILWAFACIFAMVVPTTLFFRWRFRQGAYTDEDVSQRHQRTELYLFGVLNVVVSTIILQAFGLPRPFLALLVAALLIGLLGVTINAFWKISVHAGSVASAATVASLYAPELGVVLWLGTLAVGWARVRTGNHSPMQVVAGALLSASVVLLVFRWLV